MWFPAVLYMSTRSVIQSVTMDLPSDELAIQDLRLWIINPLTVITIYHFWATKSGAKVAGRNGDGVITIRWCLFLLWTTHSLNTLVPHFLPEAFFWRLFNECTNAQKTTKSVIQIRRLTEVDLWGDSEIRRTDVRQTEWSIWSPTEH